MCSFRPWSGRAPTGQGHAGIGFFLCELCVLCGKGFFSHMNTAEVTQRLEAAFEHIHRARMADVPILNAALRVQAVGAQPWQGHWLAVLITPWFMNLILLPGTGDDWQGHRPGSKRTCTFPSGVYEFIAGHEDGLGPYQACSLFSPVLEFEDQTAALAAAEAALEAVMEAPEAPQPEPGAMERPISRRDLLRGAFRNKERREG